MRLNLFSVSLLSYGISAMDLASTDVVEEDLYLSQTFTDSFLDLEQQPQPVAAQPAPQPAA